MKKLKIIFILLIVILLSGCNNQTYQTNTINYNLKINDKYEENIIVVLPKNADELAEEIQDKEFISFEFSLLNLEQEPIFSNHAEKYKKKIKKNNENILVELKYNYAENDFINSNYIKNCFQYNSINNEDDYLEIKLSGEFYCLQDKSLNIAVTSKHPVIETNGNLNNNITNWIINQSNYKNVNIYYKIQRNYENMQQVVKSNKSGISDLLGILLFGSLVSVCIIVSKIIKNKKNKLY